MRISLGSGVSKQCYMPDNSLLKGLWLGRVNTLRENSANGNEEGTCQFSGPAMTAMGETLITAHKSTVEAQSSWKLLLWRDWKIKGAFGRDWNTGNSSVARRVVYTKNWVGFTSGVKEIKGGQRFHWVLWWLERGRASHSDWYNQGKF